VVDDPDGMILVGVVTDRDLAIRHVAAAHHHDCSVREHMTTDPLVTVGARAGVDDVMKKMKNYKVRRVMVTDGDGVLLGVVAQADLVREEGDEHPRRVEKVLEEISEPAGLPR
jgi:signal-transduction protein with cAMP-binding, CBS, and nucleotidyltransferase domain